ncbi:MAG: peptidoglycan-binding protein [Verrucomicrobiota bacterium]|nr:peptidoglycan-binding protein [Verrucomicrobiota bacterium]
MIASTQQALKDQGFYYGEITGKKDADTSAALRRYQIRNGLQVTGELNAETQKALGVKGTIAPPAVPRATPPPPKITTTPPPENSDLREEAPVKPEQARPIGEGSYDEASPGVTASAVLNGTPYQNASPDMQRRVIMNAQNLLARRGYLRSAIDGEFGSDTEFALRAFQARFNLRSSGRLDRETLAAMGLMPGQRAPGVTAGVIAPRQRVYPRTPQRTTPEGELIYEGR